MIPNLPKYPLNPDYGTGIFRRAIRLVNGPGEAVGELEDDMHAMRCTVRHDGARIVDLDCDFIRIPMTTCPGAIAPISELIGEPIDRDLAWFYGEGRPRRNCTHLHDLAWWTIAHALREAEPVRAYEADVPDGPDGVAVDIRLLRNGEQVVEWRVLDGIIQTPGPLAGQHVLSGFSARARAAYAGDELEAALVLHKAYFVSTSRRMMRAEMIGPLGENERGLQGVCWSYQPAQMEHAIRHDTSRDFSHAREKLLKFE